MKIPLIATGLCVASLVLLTGCPDTKMPKAPPKIPEPKAAAIFYAPSASDSGVVHRSFANDLPSRLIRT